MPDKSPDKKRSATESTWNFIGVGKHRDIADLKTSRARDPVTHAPKKLGEWFSTAICGNDIGSSCLYVAALALTFAGKLAPLVLLAVGLVLFLFRKVYAEVGSALPLNGGAYNALLNTTTKFRASIAACLTLLSYIATAVISASEAMHYAHHLWHGLSVNLAVPVLITLFACLTIAGIGESAIVALVIFIFHIFTLIILSAVGLFSIIQDPTIFLGNLEAPLPARWDLALFFGFSAAFLGVSGFESSANFIEEQKKDVFPKTLRNMWLLVIVFNPLMAVLALGIVPQSEIVGHAEDLLAHMGGEAGGHWLRLLISINATLVLSGAVLTAFVGSNGLVRRMALDGCLPQFLLKQTSWNTDYLSIGAFWLLCCSIFWVTAGELTKLASIYTISFLSVMVLFAVGNMLLKLRRSRLPRANRANWYEVGIAFTMAVVGLVGNLITKGENSVIFLYYFSASVFIVSIMIFRVQLITILLTVLKDISQRFASDDSRVTRFFIHTLKVVSRRPVVYFSRGDDLGNLNKAMLYVINNEPSHHIQIVHVYESGTPISDTFKRNLKFLDEAYPDIRIDLLTVQGKFSPDLIRALSGRLRVPVNYMFISTPGDQFPHNIAELGGVRVIV